MLSGGSVITNPMDLQTMLKKVKQRHYKFKKEFKDDLDLIWSNCFTYNATEVSDLVKTLRMAHRAIHTPRLLRETREYVQACPHLPRVGKTVRKQTHYYVRNERTYMSLSCYSLSDPYSTEGSPFCLYLNHVPKIFR